MSKPSQCLYKVREDFLSLMMQHNYRSKKWKSVQFYFNLFWQMICHIFLHFSSCKKYPFCLSSKVSTGAFFSAKTPILEHISCKHNWPSKDPCLAQGFSFTSHSTTRVETHRESPIIKIKNPGIVFSKPRVLPFPPPQSWPWSNVFK